VRAYARAGVVALTDQLRAARAATYEFSVLKWQVTDPDTQLLRMDFGFNVHIEMACRLYGIDTPEKGTHAEKLVNHFVQAWYERQQQIIVVSIKKDKFAGRFIGVVRGSEQEIKAGKFTVLNNLLPDLKMARRYFGEAKTVWLDKELKAVESSAVDALEKYKVISSK
jgi:hypothetical protein